MRKSAKGSATPVAKGKAEELFPNIAAWVDSYGWIEIGQDDYSRSFIRALDAGGMVWEGEAEYPSLDDALRALNKALGKWIEENG
jgi:hypothetical protein